MKTALPLKIVIIGSGNLAWHLIEFFSGKKMELTVYNHRASSELDRIKKTFTCKTVSNLKNIETKADYYFICVSDRHISKVSKKINPEKAEALILHSSGSMPLATIKTGHANKAVLYPLQSFSKNTKVDWDEIPVFLQASNEKALKALNKIAKPFPGKKVLSTDESRLKIHLAAVLVNNFTNALYAEAFHLLEKKGETEGSLFNLLLPLILNGLEKLNEMSPTEAQTGPAKRKDKPVMKKHLALIKKNKDLTQVYRLMSTLITKQQN